MPLSKKYFCVCIFLLFFFAEAPDSVEAEISIIPPSATDMLINRVGRLGCKTDVDKNFRNITWLNSRREAIAPEDEKIVGSTVTLFIRISFEEWSNGTKFTCEVKNLAFAEQYRTKDFKRQTGRKCCHLYIFLKFISISV